MFLRANRRKKNGKLHRYWSIVESRRLNSGHPAQRQVLYLGEINDSQEAAWRKTIEVFDEERSESREISLFPSDRPIPADEVNALSLVLSEMRLVRPRSFGDCWLGCLLWEELGLDRFWQEKLGSDRGSVPWEKVLQLLSVNRLCEPGSEFAVHRSWFLRSAMDELLGCDFAVAEKDRLYRCLDRILPHKDELCRFLTQRWKTLFDASFDVLLYDLTSTYFEGSCDQIPKARHGYSRDGRPLLPAGGDRIGGDDRWPAAGVRSAGGEHLGQDDAQELFGQDRSDVRQGPACVGDGPRHPHPGDPGADAKRWGGVLGGHAQSPAEQAGKASDRQAVGSGA